MLNTLFKYEMKATARTFMWLYLAFIVIAVLNAVLIPWGPTVNAAGPGVGVHSEVPGIENTVPSALQMILVALYILAIAAIAIATLVIVIMRFYRNLLGDEGYLMMTLPVSREQHIVSKLFVAVLWTVCSAVLILLSILLLIATSGNFSDFADSINEAVNMGMPVGRWAVMAVLLLIVGCFSGVLMLYAAMAVGPNLLKNRVGGSILAYIIIYVVCQIVMMVIVIVTARPIGSISMQNDSIAASVTEVDSFVGVVFTGSLIGCAAIGVACWFLTRYMLRKKLNLA